MARLICMANAALSTNWFGGSGSPVVRQDRQDRMTEASDEDLMASAACGNEAAFRLLAARHAAPSIRLAQRLTGNAADAEDIAQEALLRVWTQASGGMESVQTTSSWVSMISSSCCRDP